MIAFTIKYSTLLVRLLWLPQVKNSYGVSKSYVSYPANFCAVVTITACVTEDRFAAV